MILPKTQKEKKEFLIQILWKLHIEQNEREIYILSLDILSDEEFNIFFEKILSQVFQNGEMYNDLERKKLEPLSANII